MVQVGIDQNFAQRSHYTTIRLLLVQETLKLFQTEPTTSPKSLNPIVDHYRSMSLWNRSPEQCKRKFGVQ
uniref:Uncharacterized protein n=1 Tax=Romanomermis culicivorax TaxID=13658 RepID=A0A915HY35_ROMCU